MKLTVYIFLSLIFYSAFSQSPDVMLTINRESDTPTYKRLIVYYNCNYVIGDSLHESNISTNLFDWSNKRNDDNVKIEALLWKLPYTKLNSSERNKIILEAGKLAKQINSLIQEANVYFIMAQDYKVANKNIDAYEYFYKAIDLYEKIGFENVPNPARNLLSYSDFLYKMGDYTAALKWLSIAEKYKIPQDRFIKMHIPNTIALCYKKLNNLQLSIYYNLQAIDIAKKDSNAIWIGILSGNLADNYISLKQYEKAIPYLQTSIALAQKHSIIDNEVEGKVRLAQCYLNTNNIELAFNTLQKIDSLTKEDCSLTTKINYNLQYATYYKIKNDANRELYYYKNYHQLKDSAFNQSFGLQFANNRVKIEVARKLEIIKQLNAEKKTSDFIRNLIILFLVFIAIIGVVFFYHKNIAHKQKQKLLKLENEKLEREKLIRENELVIAEQKLQEFTNYIIEKNNLIEKIQNELSQKQQNEIKKIDKEIDIEKINQLSNLTILTEDDWINFKKLFDDAFPKFITNLNISYPQLTKAEQRFICLSKLKLSTKDMANMLAISPSSLHQLKYRLRQKLNQSGDDIEVLLD